MLPVCPEAITVAHEYLVLGEHSHGFMVRHQPVERFVIKPTSIVSARVPVGPDASAEPADLKREDHDRGEQGEHGSAGEHYR